MPDEKLISGVADTARWVAVYRAMETERPDALFRDPYARRLAGRQGEAIVGIMRDGKKMAWPMVVRTAVMDEIIVQAIAAGVDTVLNLAAGLDTRAWRMKLPHALHWIDVDQAEMVSYKSTEMERETPVCRYELLAMDLADVAARRALFARVDAGARRTLVITEGLLIYLSADAVASLATDLHAMRTTQLWLTDLASPGLLKWMEKSWGKTVAAGNAPFLFGPAEGPSWFTPHGWREREYRSMMEEGIRLNRSFRFARFFRWLSTFAPAAKQAEFKHFSGILLLERAS
jgi:methyltransferase (TIGR00027 family)